jgi:hypothetical protein
MLQNVSVWLYEVKKCGYYTWLGPQTRAPLFGELGPTMTALDQWADGKLLGQTATAGLAEGDESAEAYLLDIHHGAHGDYLVAIWNRLPGNKNNVSSVGIGDVVGSASAKETQIDLNRIPGYATYFWVMPSEQRVASLGLKHLSHGLINFNRYFTGFLKNIYPEHVVIGQPGPNGEIVVEGYRRDASQTAYPGGLRPTFNVASIALGGDLAFLRQNVSAISRVICKTTLITAEPAQKNWLQTLMDVSRIGASLPPQIEEAPIRIELPVTFNLAELNATIDDWEKDISDSSENDMGFILRDGQKRWLRKSHARGTHRIDVQWVDEELIDLPTTLSQLQAHRARVLALG